MHRINHANIKEWAANYKGEPFDGILCDPPYEIGFMSAKWDSSGIAFDVEMWKSIYDLLKPGGHLLAFSGSRTYHRMACAIEDAGFEIRDMIEWVYGCLSEDTEILTVDGWKRYHKAILSDTVVCYNIDNDNYELHKPTDKFYYDNKHTAYRIKSDTTDQIVSRNHRVIVERNGRKVFAQAETLKRQESVPILESLSALPDTIYGADKRASITKQSLLKKVWQQDDSRKEQWQEAGKDTVSSLQGNVLPNGQKQEQPTQGMFKKVQRLLTRSRLEETRSQGQSQLETRKRTGTGNKNDWRNQSKLERWFDLSEQKGQVHESSDKICQMSERTLGYGSHRRLCYGTQTASSTADWQTANTLGVGTPHQPRRNRQPHRELDAIQDERGTQEIRVGSRHNTTLATVEPIEYTGKVWCVTVPTGAFVARRNGQIFITGNSGFPKSLNIGKAVDKIQGNDGEWVKHPKYANRNGNGAEGMFGQTNGRTGTRHIYQGTSPYEGYGTALKPAHEPCVLARKPLEKGHSVALNVLKHGTGALNIDGSRIEATSEKDLKELRSERPSLTKAGDHTIHKTLAGHDRSDRQHVTGRFPANLIHDGSDEVGAVFPSNKSIKTKAHDNRTNLGSSMFIDGVHNPENSYSDSGSASRYFKTCELACEDVTFMLELEVCGHILGNQKAGIMLVGVTKEAERLTHAVEQFMSGKKPTENYLQDIVSTIRTTIKLMTELKTYNVLHSKSIDTITQDSEKTIELLMGLKNEDVRSAKNISQLIIFKNEVLGLITDIVKNAAVANSKNGEKKTENTITSTTESTANHTKNQSKSRYFYTAKSSRRERNAGLDTPNTHPTLKPLSLTKYLATLIKPPTGGRLLVPFSGSGSEMIGALQAGWEYVEGVELTEEYIPIAEARIKYWTNNIKVNKDGTISPIDVTKPSNLQTKVEQISLI